jgi:hypothetical protein
MKIAIEGKTFAWGRDARDLPCDEEAYGKYEVPEAEAKTLVEAIAKVGRPFWKMAVTAPVVFVIGVNSDHQGYRRGLTAKGYEGLTLQVEEKP